MNHQPSNYTGYEWLLPLALYSDRVYLDVEHNETPELIEFVIHPEFFRF